MLRILPSIQTSTSVVSPLVRTESFSIASPPSLRIHEQRLAARRMAPTGDTSRLRPHSPPGSARRPWPDGTVPQTVPHAGHLAGHAPMLERFLAAVRANLLPSISRGGGPAKLVERSSLRQDAPPSACGCHLPCKCSGGDGVRRRHSSTTNVTTPSRLSRTSMVAIRNVRTPCDANRSSRRMSRRGLEPSSCAKPSTSTQSAAS
jgi:hypothetical protein